jgi:hypothetical protein
MKINPQAIKARLGEGEMQTQSSLIPRIELAQYMDPFLSFNGNRDYNKVLGYPTGILYENYYKLYERGDIAKRIIDAFPNTTWRDKPQVFEKGKRFEDTEFNKKFKELSRRTKLFSKLNRADKLSRIGRFSILYLGFDDVKKPSDMANPVSSSVKELQYILPRSEGHTDILNYIEDPSDPKYGMPKEYQVTFAVEEGSNRLGKLLTTAKVHHTRVIHIAEGLMEDEVFGQPALQAVFNKFMDMHKVVGGSAEMFWQGAFFGLGFIADADAELTDENKLKMTDEIEEFMHGLRRYLKLQGVSVESISPQVASPKDHFDVLLSVISGATNIPKKMLTGSERGELSSEQDQKNWQSAVDDRREDHAQPYILEPLVFRLKQYGILPDVQVDYYWPDIYAPSEKDKANIVRIKTESFANYARAGESAQAIIPPDVFLTEFLNLGPDQMKKIQSGRKDLIIELTEEEKENIIGSDPEEKRKPVEERQSAVSEISRDRQGNRT